jgi:two-component system phosphate regulon response regulator PhoB
MAASPAVSAERPVVVVVEDEEDVRNLVAFNLRAASFEVVSVDNMAGAFEEVVRRPPAVVVLDRMLPDGDGIDICARIRADPALFDVAVLILTARGSERDRLTGLAALADDYVVKPFSVRELVARVRVLASLAADRRLARTSGKSGEQYRWRDLVVDVESHRVLTRRTSIELRPLEFKLLVALFKARGALVLRHHLLHAIWGKESTVRPRLVDVHVWRLRERLGAHGDLIATVHGAGYRLAEE